MDKIFDEFKADKKPLKTTHYADCNNCQNYWLSTCDGTKVKGQTCTEFTPTRQMNISNRLDWLDDKLLKHSTWHSFIECMLALALAVHCIGGI